MTESNQTAPGLINILCKMVLAVLHPSLSGCNSKRSEHCCTIRSNQAYVWLRSTEEICNLFIDYFLIISCWRVGSFNVLLHAGADMMMDI